MPKLLPEAKAKREAELAKNKPVSFNRDISKNLRALALQVDKEDPKKRTRAERLAELVWERALGYETTSIDEDGKEATIKQPPAQWAINVILDRTEGRVMNAPEESNTNTELVHHLDSLMVSHINNLTHAIRKTESRVVAEQGPIDK